jgi:IS5 family transposase
MQGFGYLMFKFLADMIRYTPQNQLTLEGFKHPFEQQLDPENRWVKLAEALPWDELAKIYIESLCEDNGRLTIDIRLAIGALIIKHKLKLSDREVVATIQENIYIQYFVGFSSFNPKAAFDPSLFVEMRKRMGAERFDHMSQQIILAAEKGKKKPAKKKGEKQAPPKQQPPSSSTKQSTAEEPKEEPPSAPHQGKLKLDATVADQLIVYPTDLGLLANSRLESERLIDLLYKQSDLKVKPRTYRRIARRRHLSVAKKRNKRKQVIRKAIGQQLRYLRRNLKTINRLLDLFDNELIPWQFRDFKIYWVIQVIYDQQKYMYDNKVKRCDDRIVNIYQPYVRPIKRGKDKADVEFGAKIGVSEWNGFSRINHISWDAHNESSDLIAQASA